MRRYLLFALFFMLTITSVGHSSEKKSSKPSKNVMTGIKFDVIPAENTIVYIDGKKIGEVKKIDVVPVKPGKHSIKLVHNKDEVEVDVVVVNKQILNFKYAFEDSGKGIGGFSGEEKEDEDKDKKEEKNTDKEETD